MKQTQKRNGARSGNDGLVVLLIDMQKFWVSRLRRGAKKRIVREQILVIRECQRKGVPLIVLEDDNLLEEMGRNVIPELQREIRKVRSVTRVRKNYPSGFAETKLGKLLIKMRARTLLLMGIYADQCIKLTAIDGAYLGYRVYTSNAVIAGQPQHSKNNSADCFREIGALLRSPLSLFKNISS